MPVLQGIQGARRVLLVTATAGVLAAGGAGVAYASGHDAAVESGYAVVSTESETTDQAWTEEECEQWKARQQQGEQPAPSESPQPGEGQQPGGSQPPSPAESAPSDVTGRL